MIRKTAILLFTLLSLSGCGLNNIEKSLTAINSKLDVLAKNDSIMDIKLNHFPSTPPIQLTDMVKITSNYNIRTDPTDKTKKEYHWGIDYSAKKDTPVYASAQGIVKEADRSNGWGNIVRINHLNGYYTAYAHLNKILVKPNQKVNKGDIIGTVGSTGKSTGNHLHFEISYMDKKINPFILPNMKEYSNL